MMRASLHTLACSALLASACLASACIDSRLSLGHHSAAATPDVDAFVPDMHGSHEPDASMMMEPPPSTGGQGGAPPMGTLDSGMLDADTPHEDLCSGAVLAVQLQCQLDGSFMGIPGSGPSSPMTTSSTFTLTPSAGRIGIADVTGMLAFDAWDSSFTGRVEGQLDCVRGIFGAVILNGQVSMQSGPTGPFYGRLDGMLDPFSPGLTGMWWHGPDPDPQNAPRCVGPWIAVSN